MQKHKDAEAPLVIGGEVSRGEVGALICDILMLGVFLYNQIFHDLNMWYVILPLLMIGIYLVFFGAVPEKYYFTETALEVRHLFYKVVRIPYTTVFHLEATQKDDFVNLLQENKVKVYHTKKEAKRLTVCRPRDVHTFAEELKKRCPEFKDGQESKLDVFFN